MTCISKICSSTKPKIKPQDQELVRTTPITPELRERALKQKEPKDSPLIKTTPLTPELLSMAKERSKTEKVTSGLREGQFFPKEPG